MYFLLFLACFPVIYKTWHTKFFIGQNVRHLKKISSFFFDKIFFVCLRKFLSLKSGLSLSKTKVLAAKGSQREIWNPFMGYYDMGNRRNNISEVNIFYFSTIIVNIPSKFTAFISPPPYSLVSEPIDSNIIEGFLFLFGCNTSLYSFFLVIINCEIVIFTFIISFFLVRFISVWIQRSQLAFTSSELTIQAIE